MPVNKLPCLEFVIICQLPLYKCFEITRYFLILFHIYQTCVGLDLMTTQFICIIVPFCSMWLNLVLVQLLTLWSNPFQHTIWSDKGINPFANFLLSLTGFFSSYSVKFYHSLHFKQFWRTKYSKKFLRRIASNTMLMLINIVQLANNPF
jgi:hypothetical protein